MRINNCSFSNSQSNIWSYISVQALQGTLSVFNTTFAVPINSYAITVSTSIDVYPTLSIDSCFFNGFSSSSLIYSDSTSVSITNSVFTDLTYPVLQHQAPSYGTYYQNTIVVTNNFFSNVSTTTESILHFTGPSYTSVNISNNVATECGCFFSFSNANNQFVRKKGFPKLM